MSHIHSSAAPKEAHESGAPQVGTGAPAKAKKGENKSYLYNYVFFLLLDSMAIRQSTVFIQSKNIESNASAQEANNALDKSLQFKSIPVGAKTNTINQIQNENQAIAAQRENVQNVLITLRQQSQVTMTETSTNVNNLEQDASMDSGWLGTLQQIFQVINQISQPI